MKTIKKKLTSIKTFSILLLFIFFVGLQSPLFPGPGPGTSKTVVYEMKELENKGLWICKERETMILLTSVQLEKCKISVTNFRIHRDGKVFTSSSKNSTLYVMDGEGNIYIIDSREFNSLKDSNRNSFVHASFFDGASVAGAGEIYIVEGKLQSINNFSGHYRPPEKLLHSVIGRLNVLGLNPLIISINRSQDGTRVEIGFGYL